MLRQRSLGELLLIDITQGWEVSGGPVSWTRLSHHRSSGLTPGQIPKTLSATQLVLLEDPHFIWKENKSGNLISGLVHSLFFPLCFVCFTYLSRTLCRGLAPALQARYPRAMAELTLQLGVCTEPPQRTLTSRWCWAMHRDTTYTLQCLTIFFNPLSQKTFYISQL